jgi:zinc transport system substrate-binding protein
MMENLLIYIAIMKNLFLPLIIIFIIFLGVYLFTQEENIEKEVVVVTSFYPLFDLASSVGGERIEVINLTPPGVDPHEFEPSLKDIAKTEKADIFLYNGGGLDPWAEEKEKELLEKGVVVLNMSSLFHLLEGDEHDHKDDHHHEEDPHFWLDPIMAKEIAENIFSELIKVDPEGEKYYQKNKDLLMILFDELHEEYSSKLGDCDLNTVVISHASLGYLAERYEFGMVSISGISPVEEPSAKKMAEITDMVKEKGINHIFFETTIPSTLSATIAEETGAETLVFNPISSLTKNELEEGKNYFSIMQENLEALRVALGCK